MDPRIIPWCISCLAGRIFHSTMKYAWEDGRARELMHSVSSSEATFVAMRIDLEQLREVPLPTVDEYGALRGFLREYVLNYALTYAGSSALQYAPGSWQDHTVRLLDSCQMENPSLRRLFLTNFSQL